jgi:molybdopterin-guanine dinucleotide biosynthesis protein A
MRIAALVLAGGRGSRMGAATEKPLLRLGDRPLIAHVLDRVPSGAHPVLISANRPEAYAGLALPVLADRLAGHRGPLAGLDAAAAFLADASATVTHLLVLPGDTPFLPSDLAERLMEERSPLPRIASHRGRLQPTVGLWPLRCLAALPAYLAGSGNGSIRGFLDTVGFRAVDFPDVADAPGGDPFCNVNTPEDLAAARAFVQTR